MSTDLDTCGVVLFVRQQKKGAQMHYEKQPTYEKIREIPVKELLLLQASTLKILEKEIKREVSRASLALSWIQGIQRLKNEQGGNDGRK